MYEWQHPATTLVVSPRPAILAVVLIAEIECRFEQVMVPHEVLIKGWIGCWTGQVDLQGVCEVV